MINNKNICEMLSISYIIIIRGTFVGDSQFPTIILHYFIMPNDRSLVPFKNNLWVKKNNAVRLVVIHSIFPRPYRANWNRRETYMWRTLGLPRPPDWNLNWRIQSEAETAEHPNGSQTDRRASLYKNKNLHSSKCSQQRPTLFNIFKLTVAPLIKLHMTGNTFQDPGSIP
jgi:hypothetical protein